MDFSTLSNTQLKAMFIGLRKKVTSGEFSEETNTAYFTILEYVVANKGQQVADDWVKEADTGMTPTGEPAGKKTFPWPLIIGVIALMMWRK